MFAFRDRSISDGASDLVLINFTVEDVGDHLTVLSALKESDRQVGLGNVARQVFFLAEYEDRHEVERAVAEAYGPGRPGTSYVYQPPADGSPVSAELWAFANGSVVRNSGHGSVAKWGGVNWSFVGGLEAREDEPPGEGALHVLCMAEDILNRSGTDFRRIVRTWYYMGNILMPLDGEPRYNYFNQARNEFYRDKWPDLCATPASTGIGMCTDNFTFEALAVDGPAEAHRVVWLDNPLQTQPHRYAIDSPEIRKPSFSRGAAVVLQDCVVIFVSGTASVRGSEVLHPRDPAAQTEVTIENIAALIGEGNTVANYGLPRGADLEDIQQLRVYVKRPEHLDTVRSICCSMLPDVPNSYLISDVCRDAWLMEIEAVVAFQR